MGSDLGRSESTTITHVDPLVIGVLQLPNPLVVVRNHPLLTGSILHTPENEFGYLARGGKYHLRISRLARRLTLRPDLPRFTYFIFVFVSDMVVYTYLSVDFVDVWFRYANVSVLLLYSGSPCSYIPLIGPSLIRLDHPVVLPWSPVSWSWTTRWRTVEVVTTGGGPATTGPRQCPWAVDQER